MIAGTRGTDPGELELRQRLPAPHAAVAPCRAHVAPVLLAAHAAGELSGAEADAVALHLLGCADGRCLAVLRELVAAEAAVRGALYGAPVEEPRGSSPTLPEISRTFRCDGALWEAIEQLAREEGRSTDSLIGEAMRALAQQRQLAAAVEAPVTRARATAEAVDAPIAPRDVTVREAPPSSPYPRDRNTPTLPRAYLPRAPASSRRALVDDARGRPEGRHAPAPPPTARKLAVVVEGVRYEIEKDQFVVGRGGRSSDLAIDDPGVSRQHALIEHAGEEYWLVDMGSTNGIEYQGQRIARQKISHGDRFRICDHELEFLLH